MGENSEASFGARFGENIGWSDRLPRIRAAECLVMSSRSPLQAVARAATAAIVAAGMALVLDLVPSGRCLFFEAVEQTADHLLRRRRRL
jgi:hypothetical protein